MYRFFHRCWFGYSLTPSYWFLEGPRLLIIAVSISYFRISFIQTTFYSISIAFSALCWFAIVICLWHTHTHTHTHPRIYIQINLLYLLNILRVLVTKLRNSQCSEAEQVRKALKAAFVLLPLLGITNALVMVPAPLDRSPEEFAVWSFTSHFLTSFQGFFVSLLYCFLNGEVLYYKSIHFGYLRCREFN